MSSKNPQVRRYPLGLVFLLVLIACGGTEPKDSGGLLFEGTITDAATGAPIPGTSVGVGDGSGLVVAVASESTTDAQGHYTLSHAGCINNPYLLVIAPGYYWNSKQVACKAERQTVNLSLTRDPLAP